jgi:sigma-70-like protein
MRRAGLSRLSEVERHAGVPPMSPSWPRAFRPAWRAFMGWSAHLPVSHDVAGSSGRQPEPEAGIREMSTAAGPGGGAALGGGASVAPPPIPPPAQPTPAGITNFREHSQRRVDARHCARLPALIATLPSPDREIVLLRVVAGVSIPHIVAALGVTPAAVRLAQHQALSALQPTATAKSPAPATRQRIVLLPHAQHKPTDTPPDNRRAARTTAMNHDNSPRPQNGRTTRVITANTQLHDAELALKVARHSYDKWLVAGHEDTPSAIIMHAYHTHTALHEAARAITMLIETFRTETAALITTPADGNDIPHPVPVS